MIVVSIVVLYLLVGIEVVAKLDKGARSRCAFDLILQGFGVLIWPATLVPWLLGYVVEAWKARP